MKDVNVLMEVAEALTQPKNKDLPRALDLLNKAIAIEPKNTEILIASATYILSSTMATWQQNFNKALDMT